LLQRACSFDDVLAHAEARETLDEWLRSVNHHRLLAFRDALLQYQQVEKLKMKAVTRCISETLIEDFFEPSGYACLRGYRIFDHDVVTKVKKHQLDKTPVPSSLLHPAAATVSKMLQEEHFPKFVTSEAFAALLAEIGATDALLVRNKRERLLATLSKVQAVQEKLERDRDRSVSGEKTEASTERKQGHGQRSARPRRVSRMMMLGSLKNTAHEMSLSALRGGNERGTTLNSLTEETEEEDLKAKRRSGVLNSIELRPRVTSKYFSKRRPSMYKDGLRSDRISYT